MNTDLEFDLIINGGGLAGASLALALSCSGFRIALVDIQSLDSSSQSSFDARAIALTYSSGLIFRRLNLWDQLSENSITPIRQTEVTDNSLRGHTRLRASDIGYEVLGWNVEARAIGEQLYRRLKESESVSIFSPARLETFDVTDDCVKASITLTESSAAQPLSAKVLVLADGGESGIREKLGLYASRKSYRQNALVCRVETNRLNRQIAYEHFIRSGPLALLPAGDFGYSIVWTLEPDELERLKEVPQAQFLLELQQIFGNRVGQFVELVSERRSYSLQLSMLKKFVQPRIVVVGNATHTFHPVAGQSFNLSLRDVAELTEILEKHRKRGWDIGCYDVLAHYQRRRIRESHAVASFTDGLIRVFANDYPVQSLFRNIALDVVQALPPLKRFVLLRTMGMHSSDRKDPQMAAVSGELS